METALARLKEVLAVFTGLSAIAYACGYLALRARARALGTDPMLGLLDEAYVFAGFRFVLVTMLALLIGLPVIVLFRALINAMTSRRNSPGWVDWALLVVFAALVMFQLVFALGVHGLLLEDHSPGGWLAAAALGNNAGGALATLVLTIATTVLVLWSVRVIVIAAATPAPFCAGLVLVTTMQVLLLPVLHGLFFADRIVRVIETPPVVASSLISPIAIVDRSSNRVTLLACSSSGQRRLVTLDLKALDGVGVVAIEQLRTFLARLSCPAAPVALLMVAVPTAPASAEAEGPAIALSAQQEKETPKSNQRARESFWSTLAGYLKIGFENISSLGESGVSHGVVRVVSLTEPNRPALTVGSATDLSWPVLDDGGTVYALRGRQVLRFAAGSNVGEPVGQPAEWHKLLGAGPDGSLLGLVSDGPFGRPATLNPSGELTLLPPAQSDKDRRHVALLQQESRRFEDGYELRIDRSGRGFDVYLRRPNSALSNASNCGGAPCGQPSLSPDRRLLVYVEGR